MGLVRRRTRDQSESFVLEWWNFAILKQFAFELDLMEGRTTRDSDGTTRKVCSEMQVIVGPYHCSYQRS